jgi:hypothetical protein
MIIDPRQGDAEDDISAPKARSMMLIAGSLLAEISLFKFALAWVVAVMVPAILTGVLPLLASAWLASISYRVFAVTGISSVLALALLLAALWLGLRPLLRMAETNFWSFNALLVQPGYAACREGLRHLGGRLLPATATAERRASWSAASAVGGGMIAASLGLLASLWAWPHTRWIGAPADLIVPLQLLRPALANSLFAISAFLAVASLVWGLADGTMAQPRDLEAFDAPVAGARRWRIVHLSDIHLVGERYGFRIESGRAGPRGNGRFAAVMERLSEMDASEPLDAIMITGDMTDAGRSAEWAELMGALEQHPDLKSRIWLLPGNHDVNVIDRANPARFELPLSPGKRLRQMRTLAVTAAVQGDRVHVQPTVTATGTNTSPMTLNAALAPDAAAIARFADLGTIRASAGMGAIWMQSFPMFVPPPTADGLGLILLNSNADTHFSFTNALGLLSATDALAIARLMGDHPEAVWIIGLHHHLVEYPQPAKVFSERIGTALINGSWFVRFLAPYAKRIVVMHGHRHIDWIGRCGDLRIISAPSPVMEAVSTEPSYFLLHHFQAMDGRLDILAPERIDLPGEAR